MLTQIINARILTPQGWLKDGSVIIRDNKILEVTSSDSETKLVVNQYRGGLGHKMISTANGIIFALLTKKKLLCKCFSVRIKG